jgi:hypothetical protein
MWPSVRRLQSELQIQRQPVYRQLLGRIFDLALRLVLCLYFKDTQCRFKASRYKRSSGGDSIPSCSTSPENFGSACRKFRSPVPPGGRRIDLWRDGICIFGELLTIRWNALSGKYVGKFYSPVLCLRQQNWGFPIRVL